MYQYNIYYIIRVWILDKVVLEYYYIHDVYAVVAGSFANSRWPPGDPGGCISARGTGGASLLRIYSF